MTRETYLADTLLAVAAHGQVLLRLATHGSLTEAVRASSAALFDAAAALAQEPEAPESEACPHPEDSRVSMASAGNEDFYCRVCNQHVLRPLVRVD